MHLISRIDVEGFWDTYEVSAHLNSDVTFFIGQNGTGKTTLINLLAAALTADFPTLEKLPFKKITISLVENEKGIKPTISVSKISKRSKTLAEIEYRIRPDEGANEVRYPVDEAEELIWSRRHELDHRYLHDYYRRLATGVLPALQELIKVDWLSVHRTPASNRSRDERTYESTVDRRLEAISNDLVRYFASLSRRKDEEMRGFQEFIFVSLLEQPSDVELFSPKIFSKLDEHRTTMADILRELRVAAKSTPQLIGSFYARAEELSNRISANEGFSASDLQILVSSRRIDLVVERWKKLREGLDRIFEHRNRFMDIVNGLFQRKQIVLNDSDEMVFVTRTDKKLTPQMLSSGEKQLLILLSETLLQRQRPAVFIADEPELSLHVRWQERLVPSLRELNNRSQIIAATHSPDIVGPLAEKTIDMETLIP